MAFCDLREEPAAKAALRLQLESHLLREQGGQHDAGHRLSRHENRAETLPRRRLLVQRVVELFGREQTALDEELTEWLPRDDRAMRHARRVSPTRRINLSASRPRLAPGTEGA